MISGNGDNRLMSEINVTPFVDVMLVLLIIFMVTAPMMVEGVKVNLPETTAQPLPSQKEVLVVTIDTGGQVYLNNFPVDFDSFREKLVQIMQGRKDREVFLRADRRIPYGEVVKVMTEIKDAGIEKIGMVTLPAEKNAVK